MTYRIKASQLERLGVSADQYGELVRAHAAELAIWDAHMGRVEASLHLPKDIPDPTQPPPEKGREAEYVQRFVFNPDKHMPHPAPAAPAFIDEAINRDGFLADYEIEDDRPSPEERLATRKRELLDAVAKAEHAASAAVIAPGRRRLADIKLAAVFGKSEEDRTDDDRALILEGSKRGAKLISIDRHAAQVMSDIEDLTTDTIDAWQMPAFPE